LRFAGSRPPVEGATPFVGLEGRMGASIELKEVGLPARKGRVLPKKVRSALTLLLFLGPYFVLLFLFKLLPIFINFGYSLMDMDLVGSREFVGFANYDKLLRDDLFFKSARNTLQYLLYVGPVNIVGGFLLALLFNSRLKGTIAGRTAVFAPYVIMITLVGITWRWILDGSHGLLNHYLGYLGIDPVYWLTNTGTAMLGIAMASIWWTIGYNTVIYLAALQDIPRELLDAAAIDGAGSVRRLFSITIPLVKRTTFFVVITTVIYSMQMFGQVYVMTAGGPSYSTLSFVQYLYIKAFREYELGYAATIGVALFVILLVLSALIYLAFRERDSDRVVHAQRKG
jgi:ABC-type sugar transport system permease subunit